MDADIPVDADVSELIFRRAAAVPDSVAVWDDGTPFSYREFTGRAARLARLLRSWGIGPDRPVAVALDRSADQLAAALAVLAAGGAYLPLDPSLPPARLTALLEDGQVPVLITSSGLPAAVRSAAPRLFLTDRHAAILQEHPAVPPARLACPDHLAYVIFTSGTTGRPKAAMNTRRGLLNRLTWMQQAHQLTPGDTVLQKTPVGFDVAVWECYGPLLAGARTVVARPDGHRDPHYLADLVRDQHVTVAHFVPSMLRVFLDTADMTACGSLRLVMAGGEELPAELQRRFFASGLHAELDNLYGPAETAIDVTRWRCRRDWPEPRVPIGPPAPRCPAYLLDHRGSPVPDGEQGELYLGGPQVGRGYLGQPALTASAFVPDPFSPVPGSRMYRTGDQCRKRQDGALEYHGRLDNQVKLRGVRIELSEIEHALTRQPGVRACAVAVRGDGANARLIGYVVGDAAADELAARLAEELPASMVPSAIVPLPELPLSGNGKLDRAKLPAPVAPGQPAVVAAGSLEETLARIWESVLEVSPGPDADFAELGTNSLHAAQILARVRTRFDVKVSFREFFDAGTVRGLGDLLRLRLGEVRADGTGPALPELRPEPRRAAPPDIVPSLSQQRLWFIDHMRPGDGVAYNLPVATRLRGPLDLPALNASIADVVRGQEQLRTAFALDGDGRVTAQPGDAIPPVRLVDLTGRPAPVAEALRQAERLAAAHIDLRAAPLMRCTVFRLADDDHLMVVVLHHIVADGLTVNIIDRDLAAAYRARVGGDGQAAREVNSGYRDFARWQRMLTGPAVLDPLLSHWRAQLGGAPVVLELPSAGQRPAVMSYRGARQSLVAPVGVAELHQMAASEHVTPYAVCLATMGVLLRELTGMQDFLVGSPAAGRPGTAMEDVAGFFVNTVPIRVRPGDMTFARFVKETHRTVLDALEHQYVPFEKLVAEFAPAGDLSRPPLVQVALGYHGRLRPNAGLTGLTTEPVALSNGTAKFDLMIELNEVGEELRVTAEYATDLLEPGRATRILSRFADLLAIAARSPETQLGELAGQRQGTGPDRGTEAGLGCLHELFSAAVTRAPHRVAVTDGAKTLSYRELDLAANRLANRLVRMGAGPEQLVAVCADATADAIVGLLGVLKSGAGYLPLDPRHPVPRLDQTLTDAGCRILVGDDHCTPLARPGRAVVQLADPLTGEAADPPRTAARPGNTAYVIYTSGSTGTPKGVMVSHANVVRLFTATGDGFSFGPDDVWTLFHSLAFDFSVWEIWGALLHGGRLVLVPQPARQDPAALLDLLRTEQVTVLNQTPTAFSELSTAAEEAGFPPLGLRLVIFGGEALTPSRLRHWVSGYGTARPALVNMYGITETTVHVTRRTITIDDLTSDDSPIGQPLPDLLVHVLTENMTPAPPGSEGDMYVSGAGVSRGYLNRPALTAERFVPDPFGPPGSRLYRTGDRAIRRDGGELTYLGRADTQVKLHGFRIELGEIEHALLDQAGIRAAVCTLREDAPGHPRIVAYLVPAGPGPRPDQMLHALRQRLPHYMIPAAFVTLPALPRTANGKLDRGQLPAPATDSATVPAAGQAAPHTSAEHTLAAIWSDVLSIDPPGIHDNFFSLGGDSILAIRAAAAGRSAGVGTTVERMFLYPTIAELAAQSPVADSPAASPASAQVSTALDDLNRADVPAGVTDAYPATAMQIGILVDSDLIADPSIYHDLISAHVVARFDQPAMERALANVCARHDIFRTAFDAGRFREPMQLVYESAEIPLAVQRSVSGEAARADAEEVRSWWEEERNTPFDITKPPLARCHVLVRPDGTFHLSLSTHHIVLDGWSFAQLMTELVTDYHAQLSGTRVGLAPVPLTRYRDFVAAEQQAIRDESQVQFWRRTVSSFVEAPLPELAAGPSDGELVFRRAVPVDTEVALRHLAAELGIPLKSIYFAAYMWALHKVTTRPDVVSGMQVNCRLGEEGADRVLGVLLNMVPVHMNVGVKTWAELASAAFAAELRIQDFRRFPLAKIQRLAGHDRKLFDVVFNYTDFHVLEQLRHLPQVRVADWWLSDRHSFPLAFGVTRPPGSADRIVKVTTGPGARLAGTGARLGDVAYRTVCDMARDPYALISDTGKDIE